MMTVPQVMAGLWCAAFGGHSTRDEDAGTGSIDAALLARPVLIIEDEAMIAWMLESLLEDMGFAEIRIAANGPDAITLARSYTPALILSDINLESAEMDGIDAASAIVAESDAAVLFITAYADVGSRDRIARAIPCATLLRKPIDSADLRRAIVGLSRADRLQ